ncbi:hypothetical protein [Portibacter marinus]|uniref:hypothetical protein n=1 Tax=Portibacter marinus TaxID=2898660 RepID=UPI001F2B5A46|nr:hypothetical protein [Portibacter marinus]
MNNFQILLFSFLIFNSLSAQNSELEFVLPQQVDLREELFKLSLENIDNSWIKFRNNTETNNDFEPTLHGSTNADNRTGLSIMGNVQLANDFGISPIVTITSFIDNGNGINNGGYSFASYRHYFQIRSYESSLKLNKYLFEIDHLGRVGIGTQIPRSKLEVSNGDIFINNASEGVIMTSPNV